MKPGDLVRISPPTIDTDRKRWIELRRGQIGLVLGFAPEHAGFDSYYRIWEVLIDGKIIQTQGMNLEVINESG